MRKSVLSEKSLEYAVEIIKLTQLLRDKKEFVISEQISKSGTSIGANIKEAQFAVSKADFISKLHISLKETNETEYWLDLLFKTEYIDEIYYKRLRSKNTCIKTMLIASIKTTKESM